MERSQGNARRTPHHTSKSGNLSQIAGGESRKSRKPFAVARLKPSTNTCRYLLLKRYGMSKKTKLKGRTSCIARSIWNNVTCEGKLYASDAFLSSRMMTSSENEGDVMVEKTSTRTFRLLSPRPKGIIWISTCRDRRTLSRDRSTLGSNGRGKHPAYYQLDSMGKHMLEPRTRATLCEEP